MLKVSRVLGVAEARRQISQILQATESGESFLVKGPHDREALIVNPEAVRTLQEAYMDLVGELETSKILREEDAMRALSSVSSRGAQEHYTLDEVGELLGEESLEDNEANERRGIQ